jgi:hypothetical protein
MNKQCFVLSLLLSASALTASADTFNFSYSVTVEPAGIPDMASGTLTATFDPIANDYNVTAITGTTSAWGAITGLISPGGYEFNDNLLSYPAQPYLDFSGISFTVTGAGDTGTGQVNFFGFQGDYFEYQGNPTVPGTATITPAVSGVPEPASGTLLLTGIGGIGAAFWRRRALRLKR